MLSAKKIAAYFMLIFICGVLALAIAGCGGKGGESEVDDKVVVLSPHNENVKYES